MAKKFMYVCIGIMALAVTFHIGAEWGKASIVDHYTQGIIATSDDVGAGGFYVLLDNGEVWQFEIGLGWSLYPYFDLPVPVSQVKFLASKQLLYSVNDEAWAKETELGEWVNYGSPTGPVGAQSSTWGKVKTEWEE